MIGLLLSDGWMQKQNVGDRFSIKQSLQHFDYWWSVFMILNHYCSSYPSLTRAKHKNKTSVLWRRRSLPCLTEVYNLFYINAAKEVPENIYDLLTIQGLAHWIAGDGSYVKIGGAIILNTQTQSFTIKDNVRLINVLMLKFALKR